MALVEWLLSGAFLLIAVGSLLWQRRMPTGDRRRIALVLINLPWLAILLSLGHLLIEGCMLRPEGSGCAVAGVELHDVFFELYWIGWLAVIFVSTPTIIVMVLTAAVGRRGRAAKPEGG